MGAAKVANKVMLGGLLELARTLPKETAFAVLKAKVRNAKLLELHFQTIEAGMECMRQQMSAACQGTVPRESELVIR